MANNSTSFYVNLAGNVSSQASKFGNALSTMANKGVSNMNKLSNSVKKSVLGLHRFLKKSITWAILPCLCWALGLVQVLLR